LYQISKEFSSPGNSKKIKSINNGIPTAMIFKNRQVSNRKNAVYYRKNKPSKVLSIGKLLFWDLGLTTYF
jgi:hypothetical protein